MSQQYLETIDGRLKTLFSGANNLPNTEHVALQMRGAYPTLVRERLLVGAFQNIRGESTGGVVRTSANWADYQPELHPFDFEWYFTKRCADSLVDFVSRRSGATLCLGTPTVAASAIRHSQTPALIDRNSLVLQRFPELSRSASVWLSDALESEHCLDHYDSVIFDPPWYIEETCSWFALASRVVKRGGLVVFSLFPPLTRPTAESERQRILRLVAHAGNFEVFEEVLTYDTPLFEREALTAAGISFSGNWRRGDLVVATINKPLPRSLPCAQLRYSPSLWSTYVVLGQVVKIRRFLKVRKCCGLLQPLAGTTHFVYPTVSARDPRYNTIDLWTSRNRVAQVGNPDKVVKILVLLQDGCDITSAIRRVCHDASHTVRRHIEDTFQKLLT